MSKVIDKLNDTSSCEITLKCNGAFELKGGDRGEERRVHPASMSLRLVKNNRVVDLDIRLLRLKGSEERDEIACLQGSMITGTADQCMTRQYTVSISDEFDISVGVLTEDSADCTPDSDSYEILSAKFCPFETPDGDVEEPYVPDNYEFRGRNEDISSLFSPLLGNSGYFRHALSNVTEPATHLKIGLYEFAVAYTEKREGAQYQIKGRKKVCLRLALSFAIVQCITRRFCTDRQEMLCSCDSRSPGAT